MYKSTILKTKSRLKSEDFITTYKGKSTELFVLTNKNGLEATFSNFGARLISCMVPDKNELLTDVVLGHSTIDEYIYPENEFYIGATVGRCANRIANGNFILEGKAYTLEQNNDTNHLHGGSGGFHSVVWDAYQISGNEIEFSYFSKDMEEGYPGSLHTYVTYKLTESNNLEIKYRAKTDKTTIINLTNHTYFNLVEEGENVSKNHTLYINADHYTPVTKKLIPTGEKKKVDDTPFDFRTPKSIGQNIDDTHEQLVYGNGYDHNYVLNKTAASSKDLILAAKVEARENGIILEVYTTAPGVQLYTGNFLDGSSKGKNKVLHKRRTAFCLETQYFPDAPNQSNFSDIILRSGDTYESKTVFKFSHTKI